MGLNEAQEDVVFSNDNILVCACPGSGKTTVTAEKVKHVLRTCRSPRVLLTTFSRDGANQMIKKIRDSVITPKISPGLLRMVTAGTYHSLAMRQLKSIGKCKKLLSGLETRHAIQRSLWDSRLDNEMTVDDAAEKIATFKSSISFAHDNPDLTDLVDIYQSLIEEMGGMDFTDILLLANHYMRAGELKPLDATHVFADEYQDTDAVQAEWLEYHMGAGRIACAVGDDDQSIYAFRRSLGYRGMMRFCEATGARTIRLDTNYRSTAGIIACAGSLIAANIDRIRKDFKSARGKGAHPELVVINPKQQVQSREVIKKIMTLCGRSYPDRTLENTPLVIDEDQIAVLARTNMQLDAIEDACRRESVPYYRAGKQFWDIPVLQMLLTLLKAGVDGKGAGIEIGLRWAGMKEGELRRLGQDLWALDTQSDLPKLVRALLSIVRAVSSGCDKGSASAANAAIDSISGWMKSVLTGQSFTAAGECWEDAWSDGRTPAEKFALKILGLGRASLKEYSGSLRERLTRLQNSGSQRNKTGVFLATHHASKGLEWKHVLLIDFYDGSVPSAESAKSDSPVEALEEERRIAYVAMTRARDTLTIYRPSDRPLSEFLIDSGLAPALLSSSDSHISSDSTLYA